MAKHVLILLGLGAVVRAAVWLYCGEDQFFVALPSVLWQSDCGEMLANIPLALTWEHTRPPLLALRGILKCGLWPAMHPAVVDLVMVSFADLGATIIIYLTFCRLSVPSRMALAVAGLWSISLIAWEYYRFAGTHNHLNPALMALVVYATVHRFQNPGLSADLLYGVAGALLVAGYGPGVLIVFFTALVSIPWRFGVRRMATSLVLAASLPALLFVIVGAKNYARFGTFSTTTYLSINLSQYGYISLGYEAPGRRLIDLMPDLKPSAWWRWCFERRLATDTSPAAALRGLQGQCLQFDDPASVREGLEQARLLKDDAMAKRLAADLRMSDSAPWVLRVGNPPIMTSTTEVAHNDISKRLWPHLLRSEPLSLLRTFLMANRSFFVWGPLMFDGVHHEPHLIPAPKIINGMATGMAVLVMIGVVFGAGLCLLGAVRVVRFRGDLKKAVGRNQDLLLLCGLVTAYFLTTIVINSVSCCENGRQFQSLSVIPLVAGTYLVARLSALLRGAAAPGS